ncbi:response regulator transcription factor [Paenibacillus albidus]|uniref:response regulator transcription factor n=1 Tax=Paenibacillus albidus TaxID=2041023 RepID=UPI001BEB5078|nr:response regulator transcription factor [Paenibacillus albidus]MBT2290431.1 response regulator transcription factor [Paenibacillus albidus]
MQSKILIVEDDREIHELLMTCLHKENYQTVSAYDGEVALHQLKQSDFELIILDLIIPKIEGYEVLRRIREKHNTPVLILSAKGEEVDKMIGLGLGADDYVTKPFGLGELTARVRAMLRRYLYLNHNTFTDTSAIVKHGDIAMNYQTYEVEVGASKVTLTAKEFDILKLLLSHPSRVFTKSQIYQAIWKEDCLTDENTVMVHIRRLRIKIELDPSEPKYIQTVWGIGYKLGEV